MSAITIYGNRESGNCWKGKWVADLLGVANEWVEIDIFKGESRTPDFLKLNPAGQVPVAVLADGRTLAQSNAIMLHLAEGSRLVPTDSYARAKMYEWLFWEQYNHEPSVAVRRAELKFRGKTEETVNPALKDRGEAALARMELQLKETPYLVGDALSLADVACVAYTRVAHEGGFDLAKFPAVKAWVARVERDLNLASAHEAA
ncbi:MAG: glutathione S-transferase family protein [Hydrogenophilaceae bacterium]|jgi:glutathione S-transferase|nr:glutathione S-transferase family protein [Hydrogenophilaceae bacterium]